MAPPTSKPRIPRRAGAAIVTGSDNRSNGSAGAGVPEGSRDHCTRTKDSGTSRPDSGVASMQTGTMNVLVRHSLGALIGECPIEPKIVLQPGGRVR